MKSYEINEKIDFFRYHANYFEETQSVKPIGYS